MESEITDFNFSLNFTISGSTMQPILYISGNSQPPPEYVALMLKNLSIGEYSQNIYTVIQNYAEDKPEYREYLDKIVKLWMGMVKDSIAEAKNTIKNDKDKLVVRPTQFIRYEGFAGNE